MQIANRNCNVVVFWCKLHGRLVIAAPGRLPPSVMMVDGGIREVVKKKICKFFMTFAIKRGGSRMSLGLFQFVFESFIIIP